MNTEIENLVDDVWQSDDGLQRSSELEATLPTRTRRVLEAILTRLEAQAGGSARVAVHRSLSERETGQMDGPRAPSVLLLLMFAIHHSDTLVYLPDDERDRRYRYWSDATGVSPEVVREAALLGPVGLKALINHYAPS